MPAILCMKRFNNQVLETMTVFRLILSTNSFTKISLLIILEEQQETKITNFLDKSVNLHICRKI